VTHQHAGVPGAFIRLRASGWIISLCLHGTAMVVAAMLATRVGLAPPSALFHWDVTVVTPSGAPSAPLPTTDQPQSGSQSARLRAPSKPSPPQRFASQELPQPARSALTTDVTPSTLQASPPALPPPPRNIEQEPHHPLASPHSQPLAGPHEEVGMEQSPTTVAEFPSDARQEQTPASSPAQDNEPLGQSLSPPQAAHASPEQQLAPTAIAALAPSTRDIPVTRKADYGWLAGILLPRIEALKHYPADARLKHAEGRVVVRIVIHDNGHIASAVIAKSSGYDLLDQAALETIRQIAPLTLSQPLEQASVTIHVPIGYYLDR